MIIKNNTGFIFMSIKATKEKTLQNLNKEKKEVDPIEIILKTSICAIENIKKILLQNIETFKKALVIRTVEKKEMIYLEFIQVKEKKLKITNKLVIQDTRISDKILFKRIMDTIINYLKNNDNKLSFKKIHYINTINYIRVLKPKHINKYIEEYFNKDKEKDE